MSVGCAQRDAAWETCIDRRAADGGHGQADLPGALHRLLAGHTQPLGDVVGQRVGMFAQTRRQTQRKARLQGVEVGPVRATAVGSWLQSLGGQALSPMHALPWSSVFSHCLQSSP